MKTTTYSETGSRMFYELAASSWGEEERAAIARVVESDRFTMGPCVAEFEATFAAYLGREHAVMVNSGSSANLVAIASLFFRKQRPLQRGDEVIVPALSWSTTYHPLQQYGLRLKFVDIERDTLNVDCAQLAAALGPRTRMIVAVSILGNPAALDVMRDFADAHDLIFFEDNCESLDAELNGRKTGAFGDIAAHSFFFSHHIATMEGGMAVTDDAELYHLMRSLRAHGWTRDLPPDSPVYTPRDDDFYEAYRFILPGYNLRPMEMSGAIGLEPYVPCYAVVDEAGRAMYPLGGVVFNDRAVTPYEWSRDNLKEVANGILRKADSVAELAGLIGCEAEALSASLARWNAACAAGTDADFARPPKTMVPVATPPFYLGEIWPVVSNTQGGPAHDVHQQVLTPFGEPIARLYEAGEVGSIWGHLYLSGANLSECFIGGRIAGREAAELQPWADGE